MTSPSTAAQIFPLLTRYKIPDNVAPKIAPVKANGGIPITVIRIKPIAKAQRNEYQGPIKTAIVILIRCAIGHIPSTRKMGEMTTPTATIIEKKTKLNK